MVRRGSVVLILALLVGACSSNNPSPSAVAEASPTAAASATAAATVAPSPSPVDVSQAFLAQIAKATSGKMDLSGTLEVGSQSGAVTGSLTYVGSDLDQTETVALGGNPVTTRNIHKAGVGYTQSGDGPWFQDATTPASGKTLTTVLSGIKTVTDAGVETKNGTPLHRLELPAGTALDPAAFGLSGAGITNPVISLVFYADETGKPAIISITLTWTQAAGSGSAQAKLTLDMQYTQIGGSLSVSPPDSVWSRFTSKRFHYKIAYQGDWDVVTSDKKGDFFDSPGDTFVGANRYSAMGFGLNEVAKLTIAYDKATFKFTLNSNVGYTLAGAKARLLTFHATVSGKKVVIYEVQAIKGSYVYDLFWESPKGHEAADLETFKEMLGTFAFS